MKIKMHPLGMACLHFPHRAPAITMENELYQIILDNATEDFRVRCDSSLFAGESKEARDMLMSSPAGAATALKHRGYFTNEEKRQDLMNFCKNNNFILMYYEIWNIVTPERQMD